MKILVFVHNFAKWVVVHKGASTTSATTAGGSLCDPLMDNHSFGTIMDNDTIDKYIP